MGIELLGAKVDSVGRLIYSDEPAARKIFFEAVYETPAGKEFLQYRNPASIARLAEILQEKFLDRGRDILVEDAAAVIRDLIATRDPALFPAEEPEAEVVDDRLRNQDGTFKSEFQDWSEKHGASECAERARVDREYAEWRRQQYSVQGLQDGLPLAGVAERPAMSDERASLSDFVSAYNAASAHNLRPRGGFVTLDPTHRYAAAEFTNLVTRSAKLGLI
jgi:hypothetical protein